MDTPPSCSFKVADKSHDSIANAENTAFAQFSYSAGCLSICHETQSDPSGIRSLMYRFFIDWTRQKPLRSLTAKFIHRLFQKPV
ncbi:hypothetical protein SINU_01040 [Sporolactobacillus inulinus CASD]|jgi:hypothetical protein|uniref:Uncharacterized protein n=1 Tax=Sporolactobacillus inulinus CASD TaxID=1069536 RepID=A0A0U1QSJ5_9BACL|nr:hypothetical protein [Sporolactobacillus inulinus]KLI03768.1 hypothetical protein SINU_01040 [Sporolactobacillus inulinus CASD]